MLIKYYLLSNHITNLNPFKQLRRAQQHIIKMAHLERAKCDLEENVSIAPFTFILSH